MAMDFKKSASKLAEEYRNRTATGGNSIANGIRSMINADGMENQIQRIPHSLIDDFNGHPFRVREDAEMWQLVESVRENGVLLPVIVRPKKNGRYEMISGHRRKRANELAGFSEIPAIIMQLTDEQAVILMVDSNLHREHLLPSEKAFAYKMKMEAIKRKGGRPSKENSTQVASNFRSDDTAAKEMNMSGDTIRRYIRLTKLRLKDHSPDLLDMVDEGKLPFMAGVALSYLPEVAQITLLLIMEVESFVPSLQQAEELKQRSKEMELHETVIREILFPDRFPKKADDSDKPQSPVPFALAAQREREEAAQRELVEAELEAREEHAIEQVRMKLADLQRDDPHDEPVTIGTQADDTLHVFFQAAEETHEAMLDQSNAERTAKLICKRLEILEAWFEANTDKDTLDRFLDIVGDLEDLLGMQGLLK